MGSEYRQRIKEQYGRPALHGYDVLSVSATGVRAVVPHTALANVTVSNFTAPRNGFLDYVTVDVQPALTAGQLDISVSHGGSVVATGSLGTGEQNMVRVYNSELDNQVPLTSGSLTQLAYAIPTALSAGATVHELNVRCGLRYREA